MLLPGHTGIALGIGWLLEIAWHKKASNRAGKESRRNRGFVQEVTDAELLPEKGTKLAAFGEQVDFRLLLLGSMLPDIIDKPIGQAIFREVFHNGRIFSHTLLFLFVITLLGFYLYASRNKLWLLVISFGCAIHLVLDQMWLTPRTLFWPIYGWSFEKIDLSNWLAHIWNALLRDPGVFIPEIIGAILLSGFMLRLSQMRGWKSFIKHGRVEAIIEKH